jgi:hypothetical protein
MISGIVAFFRADREYLEARRVQWYFVTDLVLGAIALGAAMEFYGTKWSLLLAVVSVICLVDCVLLRYAYELKRAIKGG